MDDVRDFKYIFVSMISIGALVTIGQVLVLREFLVIFYGNELSIGIILAVWLLWGGIGSIVAGKVCGTGKYKIAVFETAAVVLSLLLPLTILAIRYSRILWGILPGEIINPSKMLQIASLVLFPFCVASGALFVLANHFAKKSFLGTPISRLYMAEAAGAGIGGILFHFFLLPHLPVISIASIMAIQLCLLAFVLSLKLGGKKDFSRSVFYFLAMLLLALPLVFPARIDLFTRKWEWPGTRILASDDSIYNNITVTEDENQISFFTNGLWYFSTKDRQTAEEAVHLAMLENSQPKNVLIMGASLSGVAKEVLKHPSVDHLTLVELDPDIVALAGRYLPGEYLAPLKDRRVSLNITDARNFLKRLQPQSFDVIIMIQPDPVNALISRFYTVEFFEEVRRLLADTGIFSFRLTGAENMLGSEMASYLASLYWTARMVYPDVVVIPGENTRFFCSPTNGTLTTDPSVLEKRLLTRRLKVLYVRPDSLDVMFNPLKIGYVLSLFQNLKKTSVLNYDFRPRCYFDDMVVWSKQYGQKLVLLLKLISRTRTSLVFSGALSLLMVFYFFPALLGRSGENTPGVYFSTAVVGFSHITIEIVLVLAFQVFYGFLYRQLGLLVGAFMAGLALGTWWGEKFLRKKAQTILNLVLIQLLLLFVLALTLAFLSVFHKHPYTLTRLPDWLIFPSMAGLTGVVGGLQFPCASGVLQVQKVKIEKAAGNLYGYDLAGSAAGCVITSIVLIPLYGIPKTLAFLAILSTLTIIVLLLDRVARSKNG